MPRQRVFDFQEQHKGLWVSGPRDRTPVDALRRARGVNAIRERQLRSRNGSTADASIAAAHSLTRFNSGRYQGATTILNREGTSLSTGFDGTTLHFAAGEPRSGTNRSFLFVAGGGKLEKVHTVFNAVANTYTASTIAFVDSDPDTITDSASGFGSSFIAGQYLNVSGSASNDGTYLIATATAGTITLAAAESLTAEGAGASVTLTGLPGVSQWGIDAPTSAELASTAAAKVAPQTISIDLFEAITGGTISTRVATSDSAGVDPLALAFLDTSNFVEGSASIAIGHSGFDEQASGVSRRITQTVTFTSGQDLTVFPSTDTSSDEDFIRFFSNLSANCALFLSHITIIFSAGANGSATFRIEFDPESRTQDPPGIADQPGIHDEQDSVSSENTVFPTPSDRLVLLENMGETTHNGSSDWTRFSIPKKIFTRSLPDSWDWTGITAYSITFYFLNGGAIPAEVACIRLDNLHVSGGGSSGSGNGGGMQGEYKYRFTYRNTVTGNRSNAGTNADGTPFTLTVSDVDRGSVSITNLPVSSDAQVDQREIWRTVGNGDRYFRAGTVDDNIITTFVDDVADFVGLDTTANATFLESLELPTDNDPPEAEFDDVIFDKLTAFWISSDANKQGRIYHSPVGRPESKKDFINVSGNDDPMQRLVIWNGQKWGFSVAKVFRIDGDFVVAGEETYVAREVRGVPGVLAASKETVVPTPIGIIYQAHDGVRIFTGNASTLLPSDAILPIFRGEAAENLTAFEGTTATFARDEYIISDGSQCLAFNLTGRIWRDLGYGDITALFYEADTDNIVAGRTSNTQFIEDEGTVTDAGTGIPVAWESPAIDVRGENVSIIEDVYIEMDAQGESITPTIVHKEGTLALTAITPSGRNTSTQEINRMFQAPGLRLEGTVSQQVTLYSAEFEMRQLELGITITGTNNRATLPARTVDLATSVIFEIPSEFRLLDELNTLYFIERLVVESNTGGTSITPSFTQGNDTSVSLTAVSTTARGMTEIDIERTGPITSVVLTGDFTANVQIYGVELFIRPVHLGIVFPDGQRVTVDGRTNDEATSIIFDVDPHDKRFDGEAFVPVFDKLVIDANTNMASITPSLVLDEAQTFPFDALITSARERTTWPDISITGKMVSLTLSGDFTGDVNIYGVELHIRQLPLLINVETLA